MQSIENEFENLLVTKLEIPQIDRRIVSRQRLTSMLDEGMRRSLTLVIAPTGYGKTTLLVEWVLKKTGSNNHIAWINSDSYSNSPIRFWAYVVNSLKKAYPGLRYSLQDYVQHGYNGQNFIIFNPLINEIADLEDPVILILDDFQTITDQTVLESMIYLIEHKPTNLHVVISSRLKPKLPLSRLAAQGQLLQITQEDLNFTHAEITSFLNKIFSLNVGVEQTSHIFEVTEGWAAGVQLAALTFQNWPEFDPQQKQHTFSNPQIYTYLTEEVLNIQDERVREFLLKTSILEELTPSLCDYVLMSTDSSDLLEKIQQANLFLTCMNYQNCDYRYHSLFAETLQKHLTQTYPGQVSELHRRASTWMLENRFLDRAISHAIAAGDLDKAAAIVDQYAISALESHDFFRLEKWISHFSEDQFEKYPQLGIYSAFANYFIGSIRQARKNLRQVKSWINRSDRDNVEGKNLILISWLHDAMDAALLTTEQKFSEALETIHTLLEDRPETDPYFYNFLQYNLALTYEKVGNLSAASQIFLHGYEDAVDQNNRAAQLRNLIEVSRLSKVQGDLGASNSYLNQCYQICTQHHMDESFMIKGRSAMLDRAIERNDLAAAGNMVDQIIESLNLEIDNPNLWLGLDLVYSKIVEYYLAVHDQENLEKYFPQMLKYIPAYRGEFPDMPWNLIDIQVRGWLAREKNPHTSPHLNEIKAVLRKKSSMMLEEQVALDRILYAQGQLDEAQSGLEQMVNNLASTQYRESWLQGLVLLSMVYWQQGKENAALESSQTALNYGLSYGFRNIFIREGAAMSDLLEQLYAAKEADNIHKPLKENIHQLISEIKLFEEGNLAADPTIGMEQPETPSNDEEVLSSRELEVLQLLAKGKAYKEIALELNISVNTVKSHVKHIYSKFEVNSREEIYDQARELNLID